MAVGPFEDDSGGQKLYRVTRLPPPMKSSGGSFKYEPLMSVSFAPLVSVRGDDSAPSPRLILEGPRWGAAPPLSFSAAFRHVVATLYLGTRDEESWCAKLPWDVWADQVLPHVPYDAFATPDAGDDSEDGDEADGGVSTRDEGGGDDVAEAATELWAPAAPAQPDQDSTPVPVA